MDAGTRDFATPEEAEASPLAEAIFSTGEVEGVFFGRDFISVTAAPGVEWRQLKPQVLEVLLDHFASDAPLFRAGSAGGIHVAPDEAIDDDPADAEIVAQIRELIETRVRPAVAQDGGDIVYRGFKGGTVYPRPARRLLGLPLLDDDAEERHREPAQTLCARGRGGRGGLSSRHSREAGSSVPSCDHADGPLRGSDEDGSCMLLVIDSATAACSVALLDGTALVDERHEIVGRGHAERLLPMIAELLGGRRPDVDPGRLRAGQLHRRPRRPRRRARPRHRLGGAARRLFLACR